MREIKFRAWDIEEKILMSSDCICLAMTFNGEISEIAWLDESDEPETGWKGTHYSDGRFILEQFAGIKDRNDKEIYEGDILSMWYAPMATCKGRVAYSNGSFYFITKEATPEKELLGSLISCGNYIEIIGNIHENPELLK